MTMFENRVGNALKGALVIGALGAISAPYAQAVPFGGFAPAVNFPVGATSVSVALGDFNGDGALDLAVTNAGTLDNTVSILLGAGAGSFAPQAKFATGGSPRAVVLGDFDMDNALDLAVANRGSFTVSILLGDGAGGFTARVDFAVGFHPESLALGDLDMNGVPDLAVPNSGVNFVSILINRTVPTAPGAFDLLSPADLSAGLPTPEILMTWPGGGGPAAMSWSAASGAPTYTFTIAQDPALANVVFQQTGLTTTSTDVPSGVLQAGTRHYWGVTAINAVGSTPSTTPSFTFTTATPADLNGDGVVSAADLANLLANWGLLQ